MVGLADSSLLRDDVDHTALVCPYRTGTVRQSFDACSDYLPVLHWVVMGSIQFGTGVLHPGAAVVLHISCSFAQGRRGPWRNRLVNQ